MGARTYAYKYQITTANVHQRPHTRACISIWRGRWPAGGQRRKQARYSIYLLPHHFFFVPFHHFSTFLYLCCMCKRMNSLSQCLLRSTACLRSPLTPCSGAQGSHHRQCLWTTPLFPPAWAHCQRSEEEGTVQCMRGLIRDALYSWVRWCSVTFHEGWVMARDFNM